MRATINQTMAQGMRQTASIIENTIQQVSAERHAAIEQAMGGIAQERQGASSSSWRVSEERRALLVGIEQVLDRGEWNAERWMTHAFVLLAALILVFFVVRLAYRYAADRPVGTPSRRWTACAGLGDSRADRGRSAGLRPAQFAPQVCCVGCRACGPCPSRHVHGTRRTRVSRTHGGAS